jgi:beta-galactosidase
MAEAGLGTASVYVPWNWHQADEKTFDFVGSSAPERNLKGALDDIASAGLSCVLRPGPFITAEWGNGGIPGWFLGRHPEALALDSHGQYAAAERLYPAITYAHETYRNAAKAWLDAVLDVAGPYLASSGGPVVNVQLDDEPSYWQLIFEPLAADYNPVLLEGNGTSSRFASSLLARFDSLDALNRRYGTSWGSDRDIRPPRSPASSMADLPRFIDWLEFKLAEINDYIAYLFAVTRGAGVDVRLSMLHPYLLPISALRCSQFLQANNLPLQLTDECYLALFSGSSLDESKLGAVLACHEAYLMWALPDNGPLLTMELQGSNSSYLAPGTMEMLYALTVARGIRGVSYYMMVGGKNPRGFENGTGSEYDISAPISAEGQRLPHYDVISKLSQVVRGWLGERLVSGSVLRDTWVGCYQPYEAMLLSLQAEPAGFEGFRDAFSAGDIGQSKAASLASLMALNSISFGYVDLETATQQELSALRQLWVPGGPFMAREVQQLLVKYVLGGGHLVVLPSLPELDEGFQPCRLLSDLVLGHGNSLARPKTVAAAVLYDEEGADVVAAGALRSWDLPLGAEVLLSDGEASTFAFTRAVGEGTVTMIGFNLRYMPTAGQGQHKFVIRLVEGAAGPRRAWASPLPCAAFQLAGPGAGVVCLVNPVELPAMTRVHYSSPDGKRRQMPDVLAGVELAGRGARLLPVSLELGGATLLAYSTWELLGLQERDGEVTLDFSCPATKGEVAFSGLVDEPRVTGGNVVGRHTADQDGLEVFVMEAESRSLRLTVRVAGT